jgi:hypothetical protein
MSRDQRMGPAAAAGFRNHSGTFSWLPVTAMATTLTHRAVVDCGDQLVDVEGLPKEPTDWRKVVWNIALYESGEDDDAMQQHRTFSLQVVEKADSATRSGLEHAGRQIDVDEDRRGRRTLKSLHGGVSIDDEQRFEAVMTKNGPQQPLKLDVRFEDQNGRIA